EGSAKPEINTPQVTRFALQPPNWVGMAPIPKMVVEAGETVRAGEPVFYDKARSEVQYVAPVSGEVIEINRGAKRSIAEVVILADRETQYKEFNPPALDNATREQIVQFLLKSGGWTMLRQRPFDVIPPADSQPANIFISTFDTAPLAPDLNLVVEGRGEAFQMGLNVLNALTTGKVYLGLDARDGARPSEIFAGAEGVERHWFRGPHPCGNVGVQIHHIAPIAANKPVWTLGVQEVITLGALWSEKRFDATRIVALTGAPLDQPVYVKTQIGANLGDLLKEQGHLPGTRVISGNVLCGEKKPAQGYLNYYDQHVTVVKEGDQYELFGWLVPIEPRPSVSRTFPNFLMPDLTFEANTNTHGERRAFVMTGQYERMLPMDIYPQHLMKAIMIRDFERMEGLGIYELSEEDVALCEFACTSKVPVQAILRDGLEIMREQG
ncbi:MAG: Na(+)-translocating NADH-quinone reductase subunit A, partial [Saprospiraceae bacterium]|nr:Na(+)-translocating NADH-quinone reductase subunit A [Saprospiraceae bacterium]